MAVGLPWSITVYLGAILIALIPGIGEAVLRYLLATESGNFFMFVIVCCGFNTILIAGFSEVYDRWQDSATFRRTVILTVALLVGGVPFIMPMVDRDALERRRPQNIPKTAVGIGGFHDRWQQCVYDSTRNVNLCQI